MLKILQRLCLLILLSGFLMSCAAVTPYHPRAHYALVEKSLRQITFFDENRVPIQQFHVAIGRESVGHKQTQGDMKTPEGVYRLSPARVSESGWGWFMPIGYPNQKDVNDAIARGQDLSTLGGNVGLHGTGRRLKHKNWQNAGINWTLGCLAVDNADLEVIRHMVPSAIAIEIMP
jgi:murein L,D-transpeptidase YafK